MLWCAMCRMMYVYTTLSSLALSSQPASLCVGRLAQVSYCMYIRTYSINYSTTLIIIIVIIIHTIQYIHYNYRHTKYDICLHYTVSCEEAMLYTNSCIYYTMLYYVYIYTLSHYDIWLWIIILYTTLIYYTITIIITIILIYFYFLFLLLCCCVCMRVCVVLCCLSCVYVCSLVYPRICSYMCICVCLPRITLPDRAVVKRLMCWYRGGIFREKIFTKFGKWVYQVKTDRKSIFDLRKR